jgi:crossover junction endodeoxyribonuclease RuvC
MLICGADSGLDGALAFLDPTTLRIVAAISMPAMKLGKGKGSKREISARTLVIEIERLARQHIDETDRQFRWPNVHAFLERVSSSPQMGRTSAFQFGRGYGTLEGIIAAFGWPIEYVTPAKWKKALRVPAEKDDARNRACQLWPLDAEHWTPRRGVMTQAQSYGRAEAALIALYGARLLAIQNPGRPIPVDQFAGAA